MKDKDTYLMTDTAVTASAGTTDHFAPGAVQNAPAANLYMQFSCTTTCDSSTDASVVTFSIQADSTAAFSDPTTLAQSAAYAIGDAELTAGGRVLVPFPYNAVPADKFIRGYVTAGTENLSAGKFTVDITTNPARNL